MEISFNLQELREEFECKICSKLPRFGKPVFQCMNESHVICPKCNSAIVAIKCAEKFLFKMIHDCINAQNGCKISLPGEDLVVHEEGCEFRPVQCPVLDCKTKVLFKYVLNHIQSNHNAVQVQHSWFEYDCKITYDSFKDTNTNFWNHGFRILSYFFRIQTDGQTDRQRKTPMNSYT